MYISLLKETPAGLVRNIPQGDKLLEWYGQCGPVWNHLHSLPAERSCVLLADASRVSVADGQLSLTLHPQTTIQTRRMSKKRFNLMPQHWDPGQREPSNLVNIPYIFQYKLTRNAYCTTLNDPPCNNVNYFITVFNVNKNGLTVTEEGGGDLHCWVNSSNLTFTSFSMVFLFFIFFY